MACIDPLQHPTTEWDAPSEGRKPCRSGADADSESKLLSRLSRYEPPRTVQRSAGIQSDPRRFSHFGRGVVALTLGSFAHEHSNLSPARWSKLVKHAFTQRVLSVVIVGLAAVGVASAARPVRTRAPSAVQPRTLDIYFIDVEGGQSTLVVTPEKETLLIDAGFPNEGTFASRPGDPTEARDAQRILAAAHDAGVSRIDNLLITHFHGDHDGGVVELSQLLPIRTFIDHGAPAENAETGVPGTMALFERYKQLRKYSEHVEPKPGDRLRIKGVTATVVASAGAVLTRPLVPSANSTPNCGANGLPAQEPVENPRSTGIHLAFGKFRFLDIGDLSGAPLHALTCPRNLLGEVETYLVAHHGGVDAAGPAMFTSTNPLVAIVNNGPAKGGAPETLAALRAMPSIDSWQLHRNPANGAANVADERIANLDERTSAWIKLSAREDGSFTVTNSRTGFSKTYRR